MRQLAIDVGGYNGHVPLTRLWSAVPPQTGATPAAAAYGGLDNLNDMLRIVGACRLPRPPSLQLAEKADAIGVGSLSQRRSRSRRRVCRVPGADVQW